MAKVLDMPKLSPTMEEGVLSVWHKKEGDPVAVDDLLAEVETDKATMEFRSFDQGTLLKILVPPGSNVKLGQPVAVVGAPGEDVSGFAAQTSAAVSAPATAAPAAAAPIAAPPPVASPQAGVAAVAPVEASGQEPARQKGESHEAPPKAAPQARAAAPKPAEAPAARKTTAPGTVLDRTSYPQEPVGNGGPTQEGRVLASPYVRKVARERGIDLQGAQGTGPGGRLVPADLDTMRAAGSTALARATPAPMSVPSAPPEDADEHVPLSPMRKAIARRLTESKTTVPHFYLSIDVDAAELVKLREKINSELASGNGKANAEAQPLKVSLNDLLIKACAVALVHVPSCNASFTPEAILLHKRVDISVAVAIPDGLVTPVVRRADQKSVVAIAREVRELASRARARKLKPEQMQDGTFSISNLGMFGIDQFAAVINPPEGAILAVGQVRDVPVIADGAVAPGKRLAMTLSCDHRVVDGAVGAAFLAELRGLIERPLRVLTG
jgi:pyruvate dehydrogenase E2 component (dihydrolipoamide acetyltransferase)